MSKLTGQSKFARDLCIAIGEDAARVRKINVECEYNAAVKVTIEMYVSTEQGEKVLEVINKYTWIKDEDEPDAQ